MAKTAVVNPRRRKKRARKNPSAANPRRRRRRNYGAATVARSANKRRRRHTGGRRRRNPSVASVYSSGGYRRSNPFGFNLSSITDTLPAATVGIWAARWAVKMAGPMENGEPGIKHALACWLASSVGSGIIASVFGSHAKGEYARITALGFGGDLFARKRFLKGNKFVTDNLYLEGVDDVPDYSEGADLNGFQQQSALGDSFTDAAGNTYVQTEQGWALAGMGETFVGPDGTVYALEGGMGTQQFQYPANYDALMQGSQMGINADPAYGYSGSAVAGFQQTSALGFARRNPSSESGFGYA